jgi:hypothetical protein
MNWDLRTILWTVGAIVGLGMERYLLARWSRGRKRVENAGDEDAVVVASGFAKAAAIRTVLQTMLLGIGIAATFAPQRWARVIGQATIWALVAIPWLLDLAALVNIRTWHRMDQIHQAQKEES